MNQNVANSATHGAAQPEKSSPTTNIVLGLAVASAAAIVTFVNLADEPYFVDESAMIAQSYYYTLLKSGQWNHPDWLHYAAYDHPPLPKYLFGLSLDLAGLPVPQSLDRWMRWMGFERSASGVWQRSQVGCDFSPPGDPRVLYWARVPSALFGVAGAAAVFAIGLQIHSRLAGVLAALLLAINPLYLTHARRAMSDSFAECLVAASVAVGLWGCSLTWNRQSRWGWCVFVVSESALCALAALAKLNGGVAAAIVLAMIAATWLLRWNPSHVAPLLAATAIGIGSLALFVLFNPLMTAQPVLGPDTPTATRELAKMGLFARAKFLIDFRRGWSVEALTNETFRKDWLLTFHDRARMTIWEGFGRFCPLGPRDIRTREPRPDSARFADYRRTSSMVWLPLVLGGILLALRAGRRSFQSNRAPLAWALVLYMAACSAIVVFMIPLNWDRYYLPLQAPSATLVAVGVAEIVKRYSRH